VRRPSPDTKAVNRRLRGVHLSAMRQEQLEEIQVLFNCHMENFKRYMETIVSKPTPRMSATFCKR